MYHRCFIWPETDSNKEKKEPMDNTSKDVYSLSSVGSFFSYINDARSHETEDSNKVMTRLSCDVSQINNTK